jgi:hypothetical protein
METVIASSCSSCHKSCEPNWFLCRRCQKHLARYLDAIPNLHRFLLSHPETHVRVALTESRRGSSFGPPAPVDLDVLGLLHPKTDARAVVLRWLRTIQSQTMTTSGNGNTQQVCLALKQQLPWLAEFFADAALLKKEIAAEYQKLERVVHGERKPPRPVPCPVVLPETGNCTGRLYLHKDGSVSCKICGSVWEYENWARLGRLMT